VSKPARTVRAVIRGRVQGVWYRGWAVETAGALGLNGWIRNCRNGRVEAVFSGPREAVEAMLAQCRQGPPSARVVAVTVTDCDEILPAGFRQLPSR